MDFQVQLGLGSNARKAIAVASIFLVIGGVGFLLWANHNSPIRGNYLSVGDRVEGISDTFLESTDMHTEVEIGFFHMTMRTQYLNKSKCTAVDRFAGMRRDGATLKFKSREKTWSEECPHPGVQHIADALEVYFRPDGKFVILQLPALDGDHIWFSKLQRIVGSPGTELEFAL